MTASTPSTTGTATTDAAAFPSEIPRVPLWLPVWTLTERELVRFFRQRTRLIGALGQPILFWILFGAGLRGSFQSPSWARSDMSYQEYFIPGIAVLIVLFTSIFSTISIIEDRREGFLQGVLVAPIPRLAIVLGKLCGGTVLAVLQAALFLFLAVGLSYVGLTLDAPFHLTVLSLIGTLLFLFLVSFSLTALGYCIAWPLDSIQGYHAIMSVVLMPMWLLSGAFFPAGESGWLSWVIRLNPLTYGVAGLRRLLYSQSELLESSGLPSLGLSVAVTLLFCAVCVVAAVYLTNRRTSKDIR